MLPVATRCGNHSQNNNFSARFCSHVLWNFLTRKLDEKKPRQKRDQQQIDEGELWLEQHQWEMKEGQPIHWHTALGDGSAVRGGRRTREPFSPGFLWCGDFCTLVSCLMRCTCKPIEILSTWNVRGWFLYCSDMTYHLLIVYPFIKVVFPEK